MDPEVLPPSVASMGGFFDLEHLLSYQNVLVIIAAWFAVITLRKMFPTFFKETVAGQRLLPVLPIVFCQAAVWITLSWQPTASWGERVLLGFVLGALTANAHTIFKRFGLHDYVPGIREGDRGV